jgi:hypothetical protein
MALGDMSFSTLLNEKDLAFFADCGGFLAAIVASKSAVSERLYALVDNLRRKLKYCELMQVPKGAETIL